MISVPPMAKRIALTRAAPGVLISRRASDRGAAGDERQVLVNQTHGHRALAHRRCDPLDRPRTNVADDEHAGPARLERQRRTFAIVARWIEVAELQVLAGEHEAIVV